MSGAGAVLLIAAVIAAWWLVSVRRHPWRRCPACGGSGKNAGSTGALWGDCGRCGKSGKVRRLGARREK